MVVWEALTCTRTNAELVQVTAVPTQTTQVVHVTTKELLSILKVEVAFACQATASLALLVLSVEQETTRTH